MRRRFLLSVLISDLVALLAALVVATVVVFETVVPWNAALPAEASIWPLIGLLGAGLLIGSYVNVRMWATGTPRPSYGRAVWIVGLSVSFTAFGLVVWRTYWSRPFFLVTAGVWLLGSLAHRAFRRRRPWTETLAVITNEKGLADDLREAQHADLFMVFDPGGEPPSAEEFDPHITLVVDLRGAMSDAMAQFVSSWSLAGYPMRSLPAVYEEHTGRMPIVHLAQGWELSAPVRRNEYAPFKRWIDVLLVTLSAPLWLPLMGLIALAVRLDSRGPVLYRQERVTLGGDLFTLIKFRTMVVDAEPDGPQFAAPQDDRLTRVGRWLRRSRLDEIPQLWNVMKGDLSLVGPRPERPEFTKRFDETIPFYGYRHLIRPGVTGWAQVNYGYADDEADTVEKLTYDLFYVKRMSLWLDLQILGRSIWTVLSGFRAR